MNPESVPESLKYSKALKPLGLSAKVNTRRFQPETSTGGYSAVNRTIRIPVSGSDVFIDTNRSYLRFSITTTITGGNPNTVYLDDSAYSIIDSLRVLDSATGMVLEEINGYNQIMNRLANLNYDYNARVALEGQMAGFSASSPSTSGNYSFSNGTVANFMLPLIGSGLLNMSSSAHNGGVLLPIALTNGLTIEINLIPNYKDAFVWNSAGTTEPTGFSWTVDSVSYDACVINFDSMVVEQMRQAGANGIYISSYTYHGQQVSSSSATVSLNLNERAKSIKSVYVIPRLDAQSNNLQNLFSASPAPTNGTGAGTLNAYLQLASMIYPNVQLNNYTDCFRELKKALGSSINGAVTKTQFEGTEYIFDASVDAYGQFTLGYDLDTVPRDVLEAGYNNQTNSQPIIVNLTYNSAVARTYQVATLVDMVIKIDPVMRTFSVSW